MATTFNTNFDSQIKIKKYMALVDIPTIVFNCLVRLFIVR